MRHTWTFHSAGQIFFGRGAANQLGDVCRQLGGKRVLVVTDPILTRNGLLERIRQPLDAGGADRRGVHGRRTGAFHDRGPGLSRAWPGSFAPMSFVGLGGGSNMDLAKICATLWTHGGKIADYVGDCKIPGPIAPLVCVADHGRDRFGSLRRDRAHRCREQDQGRHPQQFPQAARRHGRSAADRFVSRPRSRPTAASTP